MKQQIRAIHFSIILLSVAMGSHAATPKPTNDPNNGRFVFSQISDMRADQYLLDTQTGRVWVIVVGKEGERKLQPISIIQQNGLEAYIPEPEEEAEAYRNFVIDRELKNSQKK